MEALKRIIAESLVDLGIFGLTLVGIGKLIDLYQVYDIVGKGLILLVVAVIVIDNAGQEKLRKKALRDIREYYKDEEDMLGGSEVDIIKNMNKED